MSSQRGDFVLLCGGFDVDCPFIYQIDDQIRGDMLDGRKARFVLELHIKKAVYFQSFSAFKVDGAVIHPYEQAEKQVFNELDAKACNDSAVRFVLKLPLAARDLAVQPLQIDEV